MMVDDYESQISYALDYTPRIPAMTPSRLCLTKMASIIFAYRAIGSVVRVLTQTDEGLELTILTNPTARLGHDCRYLRRVQTKLNGFVF